MNKFKKRENLYLHMTFIG